MNLAPPIPRFGRPGQADPAEEQHEQTRAARRTANRAPAKSPTQVLQRERHQPDYLIVVAVIALAAIGILMVFSSSAMRGYVVADDPFQIVGPQIQWAVLGIIAMLVMVRVDYRYLRLVSIPFLAVSVLLLVLVFVDEFNIVVGGSARWLKIGPLPAIHPAEIAKLAMIVYLAHWFAKRGTKVRGFWTGTIPFLIILAPIAALVFKEPDLGTTTVITLTGFTMFFLAGANLAHVAAMVGTAAMAAITVGGLQGYQMERIRTWLDPWSDPLGSGFHTVQGLLALGAGGILGRGLGQSLVSVPNAFNDFIFAEIGQEFGLVGAVVVIALFALLAYSGARVALAAPDTFGALLAAGITGWLCIQAFINIAVVVTLVPITGITLPFLSAGGSSLIVSFAAVGILLSISRETIEKGTWNDDASADRGRRDRRTHLPGAGRRPVAARTTRRR
jgi:cell division protein FtsW